MRQVEVKGEGDRDHDDHAAQEGVHDREAADAEQMCDPPHRRHEGVLDGSLPSLPRDREGHVEENQGQVAPQQRADQQVQLSARDVDVRVRTAERSQSGRQVADAERADDAVDEPDDFPDPVPLVEVALALEESEERIRLETQTWRGHLDAAYLRAHHSSSCSASLSSSKVFPVSRRNTSSSDAPSPFWLCCARSSAGVPSARILPRSRMITRSQSRSASSRSWVLSSTVTPD